MSTNIEKTIEYLENIQSYYLDNGKLIFSKNKMLNKNKFISEELIKKTAIDLKKANYPKNYIRNSNASLRKSTDRFSFSKYEHDIIIFLIKTYKNQVEKTYKNLGFQIDKDVIYGTLPLGILNACVISSPFNVKIILFNDGLFDTLNMASKIIASFMPIKHHPTNPSLKKFRTTKKEILKNIKKNKLGNERFIEFISCYLSNGDISRVPQYYISPARFFLQNILLVSSEIFILSHEYAHLYLNHLDKNENPKFNKIIINGLDEININEEWKKEIYADALGALITMKINESKNYSLDMCYIGVDFFFSFIEFLETIRKEPISPSHPPSNIRRFLSRKLIIENEYPESFDKITTLGDSIKLIFNLLWKKNQKEILARLRK